MQDTQLSRKEQIQLNTLIEKMEKGELLAPTDGEIIRGQSFPEQLADILRYVLPNHYGPNKAILEFAIALLHNLDTISEAFDKKTSIFLSIFLSLKKNIFLGEVLEGSFDLFISGEINNLRLQNLTWFTNLVTKSTEIFNTVAETGFSNADVLKSAKILCGAVPEFNSSQVPVQAKTVDELVDSLLNKTLKLPNNQNNAGFLKWLEKLTTAVYMESKTKFSKEDELRCLAMLTVQEIISNCRNITWSDITHKQITLLCLFYHWCDYIIALDPVRIHQLTQQLPPELNALKPQFLAQYALLLEKTGKAVSDIAELFYNNPPNGSTYNYENYEYCVKPISSAFNSVNIPVASNLLSNGTSMQIDSTSSSSSSSSSSMQLEEMHLPSMPISIQEVPSPRTKPTLTEPTLETIHLWLPALFKKMFNEIKSTIDLVKTPELNNKCEALRVLPGRLVFLAKDAKPEFLRLALLGIYCYCIDVLKTFDNLTREISEKYALAKMLPLTKTFITKYPQVYKKINLLVVTISGTLNNIQGRGMVDASVFNDELKAIVTAFEKNNIAKPMSENSNVNNQRFSRLTTFKIFKKIDDREAGDALITKLDNFLKKYNLSSHADYFIKLLRTDLKSKKLKALCVLFALMKKLPKLPWKNDFEQELKSEHIFMKKFSETVSWLMEILLNHEKPEGDTFLTFQTIFNDDYTPYQQDLTKLLDFKEENSCTKGIQPFG
jgi:hypothetical protein